MHFQLPPFQPGKMRRLFVLFPILLTLLLIAWTLLVYKHTRYGDWPIYPALAIFPIALLWHIALIAIQKPRSTFILYAVVHLALLAVVWVACLMLISKDSI
jgi:hypothetical protein